MQSVSASFSSSTDVSTFVKQDQNCKAIDDNTGELCGETESLRILDEFRKLYESRIEKIDEESSCEFDRVSAKLQIMNDWIKDLGEQNTMLVHTVQDLEQAACSKVKLLEEKLKQSSQLVADNISRSNNSEEALSTLSNRVSQLQKEEEYLHQKIECLQSDIRGLLELIRRARWQNDWSLDGIKFFEIEPKDIPEPLDCICGQEQINIERIKCLNLEIERHQEKEKAMIRSQLELEGKMMNITTELSMKDETIKRYASRLQNFCEKLKEHTKQTNQVISFPLTIAPDQDYDIILTPDILESVLIAKDTESENLRRQLQDIESKLMVHTYESNIDANNLRVQLEEKCKKVQQLEDKVTYLEKEATETRDVMTAKIVALEKQNHHASIGNRLKDDLIKEMRKGLKQVTLEGSSSRKVRIDTSTCPEKYSLPSTDISRYSKKDELVSFLNSTKTHIQKECEILSDLKLELEKFVEILTDKNNSANDCIMSNSYANENSLCTSDISDKLVNCIEIITKMYSEREKEIILFDGVINKEESHCICEDSKNIKSSVYLNGARQFKLMEEFRVCTVEAQAATEDIREEINTVTSIFSSRHQNYEELSKMIVNVQDYLTKTREGLIEAINRLELQEEERLRHSERIVNGKLKLKDIKNQINQVQSDLFRCINNMQENIQECNEFGYAETCISNELLALVTEEIEQIVTNLQLFQTQSGCTTSILQGLKSQLSAIDCSLKDLQKKTSEVLINNEVANTTFCERESKLTKLEEEVDCAHMKMQDVLENFLSTKPEDKEQLLHFDNQEVNDTIKTKEDLHKLKKEYDELKLNIAQQTCQMKYDERLNKWKNRVIDLEDQIKVLQHEVKCKQEANDFLKNSIQSIEKELVTIQTKAESYRQCYSKDNIDLKKKIIELENIIRTQKEIKADLKISLNSESKIKTSADISNAYGMDYDTEAALLRCDYPSKYENISHSFKTLQDAMQSAKLAVRDLESELKRLIYEESSQSPVSARSVVTLIETLGKCREKLDTCSQELSKLKSAVYSKEKLLENMEEVIRIQRDSLTMSQTEVKDLHQKLQEKIDKQSLTIAQYEREKNELLKQNQLQIQTIGYLQNAVVEAKRNLDQMGHKAMNDLCEKDKIIRQLMICVDETQDQYNECFTEATNQDLLLDLQRDSIDSLHKKIRFLEYDKCLTATILHTMYYSILSAVQNQIHGRIKNFQELKWKMENFVQAKSSSECKCMNVRKGSDDTKEELEKLSDSSCATYLKNKNCGTEDLEYCSNNCMSRVKEYSDKKVEIEKVAQIQRLKAELQKIKDIECDLKCENQQLKIDLQHRILEMENLFKKLEYMEQKKIEHKKLTLKLEDEEKKIENLNDQITSKEEIIRDQSRELEVLRKKLFVKNQQAEEDIFELNASKHNMLSILCDRIHSLKTLLQEKSNYTAKLQADYELVKNEISILKTQGNIVENRAKEDSLQLKEKLKEVRLKLHQTEDNYQSVTEDFHKVQDQLLLATKHEANSQELLTIMEKNYYSKIVSVENDAASLRSLLDKMSEELTETKEKLLSKNAEFSQAQDKCKSYDDQLSTIRENFTKEKEKLEKTENINRDLIQQLQEYMDENYHLGHQKASLEEKNFAYVTELQDMRKSLLELKKECHLKERSLTCMSADLTEAAINSSELCKESQYVVSCIRDCMEQQKRYNETLTKNLKSKQQHIMQLIFEKKALLLKVRKLKRINLLVQRLKKTHRQLTNTGLKKVPLNGYISPSDVIQNANTFPSSSCYTNLYKKRTTTGLSIKTSRHTLTSNDSWWFPKMEHLINEVRKNNQQWNRHFNNNETESDTSLEESRDYGYQSSTSK